jgi:hypothetical protein
MDLTAGVGSDYQVTQSAIKPHPRGRFTREARAVSGS